MSGTARTRSGSVHQADEGRGAHSARGASGSRADVTSSRAVASAGDGAGPAALGAASEDGGTPILRNGGRLGLPQATALIVGSIIGVGIFNLPGSLSEYGPISIWAMALTTVGALALAVMFAAMSRRLPADGGPYAYARAAFGNATGFANAWSYWITAWAGNAAIVVGWVLYVQYVMKTFWPSSSETVWAVVFAVVGLWVPAVINLSGVKNMGTVQVWTSVIKFVPLALMSTLGLFALDTGNFSPKRIK